MAEKKYKPFVAVYASEQREALSKVSDSAWKLYSAIQTFYNAKDKNAHPSIEQLAEVTGWQERKVIRYTKELEKVGWLEVQRTVGAKGINKVNIYTLKAFSRVQAEPESGDKSDTS